MNRPLKPLIFCILFVLSAWTGYASSEFDSLYMSCKKTGLHDTAIVLCLDKKSFDLALSNPRLGLRVAHAALKLAKSIQWERGIALANNELAVNYRALGKLDSAIYHHNTALNHFKSLKNTNAQSGVMANLSLIYKSKGDYVKAMGLLNDAYQLQGNTGNFHTKAIILENIGAIYLELKDLEKAKAYYLKARVVYSTNKDTLSIARNMVNLGIILDKHHDYQGALQNLNAALDINTKLGRIGSIQITYANLGIVYTHLKDFENAIKCHEKAIQYSEAMESDFSLAVDYGNLGEVYLERHKQNHVRKDLQTAVYYLKKGYFLCDRIGFSPPQIEFAEKLVEALELDGSDYKLAFVVLKKGTYLKDSIYSKDNAIKINKLESDKEIAIRDKEIRISRLNSLLAEEENRLQKNQNTMLFLVVVILALIVGILYLLYLNRYRIYKKRMSEISQFQSHQLRTPVVKILSIIELINKQGPEKTEQEKLLNMLNDATLELDKRIHEIVDRAK